MASSTVGARRPGQARPQISRYWVKRRPAGGSSPTPAAARGRAASVDARCSPSAADPACEDGRAAKPSTAAQPGAALDRGGEGFLRPRPERRPHDRPFARYGRPDAMNMYAALGLRYRPRRSRADFKQRRPAGSTPLGARTAPSSPRQRRPRRVDFGTIRPNEPAARPASPRHSPSSPSGSATKPVGALALYR